MACVWRRDEWGHALEYYYYGFMASSFFVFYAS